MNLILDLLGLSTPSCIHSDCGYEDPCQGAHQCWLDVEMRSYINEYGWLVGLNSIRNIYLYRIENVNSRERGHCLCTPWWCIMMLRAREEECSSFLDTLYFLHEFVE